MDRQVRDQILQMLEDTSLGIQNSKQAQDETLLAACVTAIEAVAEVCQNELSAARYAHYQDIFDGMTIAFQQSREAHMTADKLNEACDLSIELIQYVEKELKHDPEVKKEIVFLPYKASMWDSLESIWRAAAADTEHCNAYVVPLPYCDRNPDGTAKEWHCEINLFPKDVPVLDYRAVDLEKMHPDVIFIHNPYDDYNAATSVSSEYYSRNIKPYTDLLVYVPYFVSGDTIAEHFCQAPGIVNADKVIVESEIIKEQYERYYPGGNPPKDKFLALGSPKYDKVCGTTRADYVLPEKWQKLIGDKKVILYNTSITAMLQHTDKFNAKLRYVFNTFKKRDDAVLWWRPHPLLKAAMDSITPAVSAEYHQIEQQYIDEGWGIYDDTPEMDRALVCTDAYYGDMSSLVWLYQKTGKPVMIADVEHTCDYEKIVFYNLSIDVNLAYFMEAIRATIYSIDLCTGKIKTIKQLPQEFVKNLCGYGLVCKIKSKFILLPLEENKILEYDYDKQSVQKVFEVHNLYNSFKCGFLQCVSYKQYRFFIGVCCSEIIKYDVDKCEYTALNDWFFLVKQYIHDPKNGQSQDLIANFCVKDNLLFLPFAQANLVIEINMDTNKTCLHVVGKKGNCYQDMTFDGKDFWLLQRQQAALIRWNANSDTYKEYGEYLKQTDQTIQMLPYFFIRCAKENIILYPGFSKECIIINIKTQKVLGRKQMKANTIFLQDISEKTWVYLSDASKSMTSKHPPILHMVNCTTQEDRSWQLHNSFLNKNVLGEYLSYSGLFYEYQIFSIFEFIKFQYQSIKDGTVQEKNDYGSKIYYNI